MEAWVHGLYVARSDVCEGREKGRFWEIGMSVLGIMLGIVAWWMEDAHITISPAWHCGTNE